MKAGESIQQIREGTTGPRQMIQLILENLTPAELEVLRDLCPPPGMEGLCSMENRDTRAKINYIRRTLSSGELSYLIEELTVLRLGNPDHWL